MPDGLKKKEIAFVKAVMQKFELCQMALKESSICCIL